MVQTCNEQIRLVFVSFSIPVPSNNAFETVVYIVTGSSPQTSVQLSIHLEEFSFDSFVSRVTTASPRGGSYILPDSAGQSSSSPPFLADVVSLRQSSQQVLKHGHAGTRARSIVPALTSGRNLVS
jgi:hypothetical protein